MPSDAIDIIRDIISGYIVNCAAALSVPLATYIIGLVLARRRQQRVLREYQRYDPGYVVREPPPSVLSITPSVAAVAWKALMWTFVIWAMFTLGNHLQIIVMGFILGLFHLCDFARELRTQSRVSREVSEALIFGILKAACDEARAIISEEATSPGSNVSISLGQIRSNVMLYDPHSRMLAIDRFTHNMDSEADIDRRIAFENWKGVAGQAFTHRRVKLGVCENRVFSADSGLDQWNFSETDWRKVRKDLAWIISVPLVYHVNSLEPARVLGVFNVDSNVSVVCRDKQPSEQLPVFANLMSMTQTYGKAITLVLKNLVDEEFSMP